MNVKIIDVATPAPAKPRTWTREELENGTAPEGLYADRNGSERIVCRHCGTKSRIDLVYNGLIVVAHASLDDGPFTHVGTVDVTLHLDRSRAVR